MLHKLNEGDVIYTSCKDFELCYHLGIVYNENGKKLIFHNSPENINKYGGSVICESYENFIKDREVINVVPTVAKNKDIIFCSNRNKYEVWDTFFFNCEDFVAEVVEGKRQSDLRDAYQIGILGLLVILIY